MDKWFFWVFCLEEDRETRPQSGLMGSLGKQEGILVHPRFVLATMRVFTILIVSRS